MDEWNYIEAIAAHNNSFVIVCVGRNWSCCCFLFQTLRFKIYLIIFVLILLMQIFEEGCYNKENPHNKANQPGGLFLTMCAYIITSEGKKFCTR